jgi:hypothetical protein
MKLHHVLAGATTISWTGRNNFFSPAPTADRTTAAAHVLTSTTGHLRSSNMVVNGIACLPTTYTRLAALPSATTDVCLPASTWGATRDIDDRLPTLLESATATALRLEKLPLLGIMVSPFCDTPTRSPVRAAPRNLPYTIRPFSGPPSTGSSNASIVPSVSQWWCR